MKDKKKVETARRGLVPLSIYWLKDIIRQLVSNKNFQDALIMSLALASIAIAFPLLPVYLLVPLILLIFILSFTPTPFYNSSLMHFLHIDPFSTIQR